MFFRGKKESQPEQPKTPPQAVNVATPPDEIKEPVAPTPYSAVKEKAEQSDAGGQTAVSAQTDLPPEELQKYRAAAKRMATAFGEVTSVLMRSPQFKGATLADLERIVVPGVATGQCMIIEAQSKSKGFSIPAAAVLWASVSPEVDQKLASELDKPLQLQPAEWKSGTINWLIVAAGDRRFVEVLIQRLHRDFLKGAPLKMRAPGADGKSEVKVLQAQPQN